MANLGEVELRANEMKEQVAVRAKEQAVLNQSSDYFKAKAYVEIIVKDANAVFNSISEIVAQSLVVKSETMKLKAIKMQKAPDVVNKLRVVKGGYKALCMNTLGKETKFRGVVVKTYDEMVKAIETPAPAIAPVPASAPINAPAAKVEMKAEAKKQ